MRSIITYQINQTRIIQSTPQQVATCCCSRVWATSAGSSAATSWSPSRAQTSPSGTTSTRPRRPLSSPSRATSSTWRVSMGELLSSWTRLVPKSPTSSTRASSSSALRSTTTISAGSYYSWRSSGIDHRLRPCGRMSQITQWTKGEIFNVIVYRYCNGFDVSIWVWEMF